MPPRKVGRLITTLLATEWRGVLKRKWNSERPPVFAHLVLSKILGACKARENLARIDCLLDLWEMVPLSIPHLLRAKGRGHQLGLRDDDGHSTMAPQESS